MGANSRAGAEGGMVERLPYDFHFASLLNGGLFLKERICFLEENSFP